ncbi:MAG: polyprenyl synthetase family protein [Candidatus Methanomethylicaceae archaeon]
MAGYTSDTQSKEIQVLYKKECIFIDMKPLQPPEELLQTLGEPIVNEAFQELLSNRIPSKMAMEILSEFSKRWKDYARPALMILACKAVGGDPALVVPAAKALILSGGAFDLHDDIIDRSYVRKEKKEKSIMGIYGQDATLLAGDALLIAGLSYFSQFAQLPLGGRIEEVVKTIKEGLFELGCAEMDELRLIKNLEVKPDQYLAIVKMKAADVESYTRVGAIIGGGTAKDIEDLGRFGRFLGMITILRDDIEDTFNDKVELTSRLTKESLPLPIVFTLADPKCVEILLSIQSSPKETLDDEQIAALISLIESNNGFERTVKVIDKYLIEAKETLSTIKEPNLLLSLFSQ